jgi:hypothetical protein
MDSVDFWNGFLLGICASWTAVLAAEIAYDWIHRRRDK